MTLNSWMSLMLLNPKLKKSQLNLLMLKSKLKKFKKRENNIDLLLLEDLLFISVCLKCLLSVGCITHLWINSLDFSMNLLKDLNLLLNHLKELKSLFNSLLIMSIDMLTEDFSKETRPLSSL